MDANESGATSDNALTVFARPTANGKGPTATIWSAGKAFAGCRFRVEMGILVHWCDVVHQFSFPCWNQFQFLQFISLRNEYRRVSGSIQLFHSVINIVNSSRINPSKKQKLKKSTRTMHLIVMPSFQIKITLPTSNEVRLQTFVRFRSSEFVAVHGLVPTNQFISF